MDKTTYQYTLASGRTIVLEEGKNGITPDIISTLIDLDRIEANEARRDREHICALVEFQKGAVHDDGDPHADPIDNLADLRWTPETILFAEERQSSLFDKIESILPLLSKAQQELYRLIRLGKTESQLAQTLGISNDAVKSRRRFLYAAIRCNLGITVS